MRMNYDIAERQGGLLEEHVNRDPLKQFDRCRLLCTQMPAFARRDLPSRAGNNESRVELIFHGDSYCSHDQQNSCSKFQGLTGLKHGWNGQECHARLHHSEGFADWPEA